jgi:hypothetical protein
MSNREDYSAEEWQDIILLGGIAMATKIVDGTNRLVMTPSRIFSIIKEAVTYQQLLDKVKNKYPDNDLIADIVTSMKQMNSQNPGSKANIKKAKSLEPLVERVNECLAQKSDEQEASQYRAFVYELAYEVCKSAGGGWFGIGEQIDAQEAEFLQELKSLLLE